jgi:MFS family permease
MDRPNHIETGTDDQMQPKRTGWVQLGVICASELVVWTGFSAILPYLPIFLQEEGHSSVVMIGFIAAAFYLGTLLFSSPFGWLSDLVGRKPLMIASMALLALASFLFTRTVDPRWFLLFRLLEGISAAASGVMFAFVADITAPAQRSRALGLVMSSEFGGAIAGPALGTALYHAGGEGRPGFYAIFYFGAALAAVTATIMALVLREPAATRQRRAARTHREERRPRYREVLSSAIVGFLITGVTAEFAFGGFEVIWSLWLVRLGASMTTVSVIWIAMSVPMLLSFVGGILADRYNRFVPMFAGGIVASLGFVVYGLVRGLTLYIVVGVVQGLAYALFFPAREGFLVQVTPPKWVGTVQGLDSTSHWLGGLIGTLLVPVLYNLISGYVFVVCGVIGLAGLAVAGPMLSRESRRQTSLCPPEGSPSSGD